MDGCPHGPGGGRTTRSTTTSIGEMEPWPSGTALHSTGRALTAAIRPSSSCWCGSRSRSAACSCACAAVQMPCHHMKHAPPHLAGDHGSMKPDDVYGCGTPDSGERGLATASRLRQASSIVDFRARHEALGEAGRPEDGIYRRLREDAGNLRLQRPLVHLWCTRRPQYAHV